MRSDAGRRSGSGALKKNGGTEILNGIHIRMTIGKRGDPKFEQRLDGPISDPKRKEIVDTESEGFSTASFTMEKDFSVPGESSVLSELLEYAEIDGVWLPSKLTAIVSLEGAPGGKSRTIQFTFRDFQIQKK